MTGVPVLAVDRLTKSFGGLRVTDDVTLSLAPATIHALIGPNGAGKTTLIGQIAGTIRPDRGRVLLAGRDVTALSPDVRALAGLARSHQISAVFPDFSLVENVLMAVNARGARLSRMWAPAAHYADAMARAHAALDRVGLGAKADKLAAQVSYGEQRQLEFAMAIAQQPKVLLLDEPLAGMGPSEAETMVALLQGLRGSYAILLVEHDMKAVFALADEVSVLVEGRVIANGPVHEIRANEAVRAAYFGEEGRAA